MPGGSSKLSLAILTLFLAPSLASSPSAQAPPEPIKELQVPLVQQWGDQSNCGPSAAAMVLGAYRSETDPDEIAILRDKMGRWSWKRFALRRMRIPGVRGGWTTPAMLVKTLNRFAHRTGFTQINFAPSDHPDRAQVALVRVLREGRPILALVETKILWPTAGLGLHWVVIRGIEKNRVVINDSADGSRATFPLAKFIHAWQLGPVYRALPVVSAFSGVVGDAPLPPPRSPEHFASR